MKFEKPTLHEDWIDPYAKQIVSKLQKGGHETYLVGGCVRDLLVGIHPKDFDIATSALPNVVKKQIANSYLIGRRFQLVLVKRSGHQFEIATFRRNSKAEDSEGEQEIVGDNYFGSSEEDAKRRDFTVNSLFYDPTHHKVIDHCFGLKDIEDRIVRMIGDPVERLIEDPIRILRAIRLSHRIRFSIDPNLRKAIVDCSQHLKTTALARRREEYLKILRLHEPLLAFCEMHDLGVMKSILPFLDKIFEDKDKLELFEIYLSRIKEFEIDEINPSDLFGSFLYAYVKALGIPNHEIENFLQTEEFLRLTRDELGIFKAEVGHFYQTIQITNFLHNPESFKKRGFRRKQSFLKNPSLPLAIQFLKMENESPYPVIHFWEEQLLSLNSSTMPRNVG